MATPEHRHQNGTQRFIHMLISNQIFGQYLLAMTKTLAGTPLTESKLNHCMNASMIANSMEKIGQLIWVKIHLEAELQSMMTEINGYSEAIVELKENNDGKKEDDDSKLGPADVEFLSESQQLIAGSKRDMADINAKEIEPFILSALNTMIEIAHQCHHANTLTTSMVADFLGHEIDHTSIHAEEAPEDDLSEQAESEDTDEDMAQESSTDNQADTSETDDSANPIHFIPSQMTVVDTCNNMVDLEEWADKLGDKSMIESVKKQMSKIQSQSENGKHDKTKREDFLCMMIRMQKAYDSSGMGKQAKGMWDALMKDKALGEAASEIIEAVWLPHDAEIAALVDDVMQKSMTHEQKLAALRKKTMTPELTKRLNDLRADLENADKLYAASTAEDSASPDAAITSGSFGSKTG